MNMVYSLDGTTPPWVFCCVMINISKRCDLKQIACDVLYKVKQILLVYRFKKKTLLGGASDIIQDCLHFGTFTIFLYCYCFCSENEGVPRFTCYTCALSESQLSLFQTP